MNDPRCRALLPCTLAGLVAVALFVGLGWAVQTQNQLTSFDADLANSLHTYMEESPNLKPVYKGFTELMSLTGLIAVSVLGAAVVYWLSGRELAAAWLAGVCGGTLLVEGVKFIYRRPRPPFSPKTTYSFPSGHSVRAIICAGLVAYLLCLILPHRWSRIATVIGLTLVVVGVGFSRLYLGDHYFSDVLGGYAFGGAWVAAWIAWIEVMRTRRAARAAAPAAVEQVGSA